MHKETNWPAYINADEPSIAFAIPDHSPHQKTQHQASRKHTLQTISKRLFESSPTLRPHDRWAHLRHMLPRNSRSARSALLNSGLRHLVIFTDRLSAREDGNLVDGLMNIVLTRTHGWLERREITLSKEKGRKWNANLDLYDTSNRFGLIRVSVVRPEVSRWGL